MDITRQTQEGKVSSHDKHRKVNKHHNTNMKKKVTSKDKHRIFMLTLSEKFRK